MKADCQGCFHTNCQFYNTSYEGDCDYFFPFYAFWEQGDNDLTWFCDYCGNGIIDKDPPVLCPTCKAIMTKKERI